MGKAFIKIQDNLRAGILALAGLVIIVPAANADILPYNDGDILGAFSGTAGTPHTGNTYLVNLGNASLFQTGGLYATGNLVTINSGTQANFVTDLGTAAISTSTGVFALFGTDGASVFMSRKETIRGTGSTPISNQNLDAPIQDIYTVANATSGSGGAVNPNGHIQLTSVTNSYASYVFGSASFTQPFEGNFGNPEGSLTPQSAMDLYQVNTGSGSATRLGAFDYNTTTGAMRFSSNVAVFAVPEPSVAWLCAAGFMAMGSARRRMRRAAGTV